MDRRRQWRLPIAVALIVLGLGLRPVAAQTCVGDCRGERTVDISDLIIGVNIALGVADVSTCEAFANSQGKVDIGQLIQGVNNALNGCGGGPTITLTGSCAAPGTGSHGLKPCDTGTPVTIFRCDDRTQCLHQQGLTMVGATTIGDGGGWSVQIPATDASAALIFQASITNAVVYRTLAFGSAGASLQRGLARDVTFASAAITPMTEAAVALLDTNGFQNYSDTAAQEVLSAVEQATAKLSFDGLTPDAAATLALTTASADPTVMMVLQTARNTPTPTPTPATTATSTARANCGVDFTTCSGCAPSGSAPFCVGDCNGDGIVSSNELITICNIAARNTPLASCPAAAHGDFQVDFAGLCAACLNAHSGCPLPPTPTATPTTQPTP